MQHDFTLPPDNSAPTFIARNDYGAYPDHHAISAAVEAKFHCDHPATEIRERKQSNGRVYYAQQCTTCGKHLGAVGKNVIALDLRLSREGAHVYDEELQERWYEQQRAYREELLERARVACDEHSMVKDDEWWAAYNAYLKTPEWAERRRLVLTRAMGLCEGCRKAIPFHVHHLTYEHVGDEFLFELVALCEACHQRAHPTKDLTSNGRLKVIAQ